MKYDLLSLVFILSVPILTTGIPDVNANYRLVASTSETWPVASGSYALVNGLSLGNADADSAVETLTGGTFYNGTYYAELRIYNKPSSSLVLEGSQYWGRPPSFSTSIVYLSAIQVGDVDGDGLYETMFVGNSRETDPMSPDSMSHIGIYRWTGSSVVKERLYNFTSPQFSTIETKSLAIWTKTGVNHMVTLGHYQFWGGFGGNSYAQLGIWAWDNSILTKKALYNWTTTGGSNAGAQGSEVAVGDVDADGTPDIVTVGQGSNGTTVSNQLRVWNWDGSSLNLKQTREWISTGQGATAKSVAVRDLDGDGVPEIIVAGQTYDYPFLKGELSVWSDETGSLTKLAETSWQTSSQSSEDYARVSTGDVDGDGTVEIVTAGYTNIPLGSSAVYYGTIGIWSWTGSTIKSEKNYRSSTTDTRLLAIATGDVDADGREDLVLGGQKLGKSILEVRNVAFVYGSIGINVSSSPALVGQSVTVSGTLTNETDGTPLASTLVIMEYSKDNGPYQIMATVTTDSQGRFANSFTPSGPGSYTVKATWAGDEEHMGASATTTLTVNKAPSVVVLSVSTFSARPGDTITVNGYLYPATSVALTITYTSPSGAVTTNTVTPDSTGAFTDQITVGSAGEWRVSASWAGSSNLEGTSSNTVRVQAQPEPIGITLSLYGFAAALTALAVSTVALVRRGRAQVGPSPATAPKT